MTPKLELAKQASELPEIVRECAGRCLRYMMREHMWTNVDYWAAKAIMYWLRTGNVATPGEMERRHISNFVSNKEAMRWCEDNIDENIAYALHELAKVYPNLPEVGK